MTIVPNDAEHHLLSAFLTQREGLPSALVPGGRQVERQVFVCPSCKADASPPEHGRPDHCRGCGLHWIAYGNSLRLWRKATERGAA